MFALRLDHLWFSCCGFVFVVGSIAGLLFAFSFVHIVDGVLQLRDQVLSFEGNVRPVKEHLPNHTDRHGGAALAWWFADFNLLLYRKQLNADFRGG